MEICTQTIFPFSLLSSETKLNNMLINRSSSFLLLTQYTTPHNIIPTLDT